MRDLQPGNAEVVCVAYGMTSRVVSNAIDTLEKAGINAGLIRPVSLWPFHSGIIAEVAALPGVKAFLTVEMSMGQMVEDVRLAVSGKKPVHFYGRTGGMVPEVSAVVNEVKRIMGERFSIMKTVLKRQKDLPIKNSTIAPAALTG